MHARSKFKCISVEDFGNDNVNVNFEARYDNTIPESAGGSLKG
jgi:hypothetical protein